MVNNYSFNLEHGAIGAHYSKNWSKQKQNEYNHWYYQTHKGEIARSRKRVTDAVSNARDAEKKADYASYKLGVSARRYDSEGKALRGNYWKLSDEEYDRREKQWSNGISQINKKSNDAYNAGVAAKMANRNAEVVATKHKNAIAKSKSSAANMIAFDISRNVSKATHAISKTFSKIKNKILN